MLTVDWKNLTQARASSLLGAASKEADRLAVQFNNAPESESKNAERVWWSAYMVYEDLLVYSSTGVNPRN